MVSARLSDVFLVGGGVKVKKERFNWKVLFGWLSDWAMDNDNIWDVFVRFWECIFENCFLTLRDDDFIIWIKCK